MKIVGAGYRRFNGCLLLIKRKDVEVTAFGSCINYRQQGLTPGFPSVVIKPGIEWPVWGADFTKDSFRLENDG